MAVGDGGAGDIDKDSRAVGGPCSKFMVERRGHRHERPRLQRVIATEQRLDRPHQRLHQYAAGVCAARRNGHLNRRGIAAYANNCRFR
jgi:hypothetical protein